MPIAQAQKKVSQGLVVVMREKDMTRIGEKIELPVSVVLEANVVSVQLSVVQQRRVLQRAQEWLEGLASFFGMKPKSRLTYFQEIAIFLLANP